jgi:hypothetical protein
MAYCLTQYEVLALIAPTKEEQGFHERVPSHPLSLFKPLMEGILAFLQIPDWLAKRSDVPWSEKGLLGWILTMQITSGKNPFAGIAYMAEQIGLKERQTRDLYNDLIKRQWIVKKGRYTAVCDEIQNGGPPPITGALPPNFGATPPSNGATPPRSISVSRPDNEIREGEPSFSSFDFSVFTGKTRAPDRATVVNQIGIARDILIPSAAIQEDEQQEIQEQPEPLPRTGLRELVPVSEYLSEIANRIGSPPKAERPRRHAGGNR